MTTDLITLNNKKLFFIKNKYRQRNLLEIYSIEEKINELRSQLKNELQFNKKIDLNILIKENEKIIQTLEKDL